jgi:hypothetical protein
MRWRDIGILTAAGDKEKGQCKDNECLERTRTHTTKNSGFHSLSFPYVAIHHSNIAAMTREVAAMNPLSSLSYHILYSPDTAPGVETDGETI